MLEFTFSVVTDDGNLHSALLAGANDLLQQSSLADFEICGCLLLWYSEPTGGKWVIDPTAEEQRTLSNNLVFVTMLRRDREERLQVEKGADLLRTSYSSQQASALNFKPCGLSLA